MAKTIYVQCSFCNGMMEVDADSGKIIQKWAAEEETSDKDKMSSALKKLQQDKDKRASLFNLKKEELDNQKKKASDLFKKEVEKAKNEGVTENPIRPFDLD